jgi:regulatory protein
MMMTRTISKSDFARALDAVTRLLANRDHSRHELEQKLSRRFDQEVVSKILAHVDECGWIPPNEQLAARAALSLQNKMKSQRYIEAHLRKRKLPLPPRDDEKEVESARQLIERKFGNPRELSFDDRVKAIRFLKFRGFNSRSIGLVLHAKS